LDLTPLACVTGVVSENGILTPAELWGMLG
jgi:methylthioribose-1-phosphate isomerase